MAPRVTYTQVDAGKKRFTVVQMGADAAVQELITKLQGADPEGKYFLKLNFAEMSVRGRVTKVTVTAKGVPTLTSDGNGSERIVLVAVTENVGSSLRLGRDAPANEVLVHSLLELQELMRAQGVYSTACLFDVVNIVDGRPVLVNYSTLKAGDDTLLDFARDRNRFDIVLLAYNISGELLGNTRPKDNLQWYGSHYKALVQSKSFPVIKETILKCSAGAEHRQLVEDVLANGTYGNVLHYIYIVFRIADAVWKIHDEHERFNLIQAFDPAFTRQRLLVGDACARGLLAGW